MTVNNWAFNDDKNASVFFTLIIPSHRRLKFLKIAVKVATDSTLPLEFLLNSLRSEVVLWMELIFSVYLEDVTSAG